MSKNKFSAGLPAFDPKVFAAARDAQKGAPAKPVINWVLSASNNTVQPPYVGRIPLTDNSGRPHIGLTAVHS